MGNTCCASPGTDVFAVTPPSVTCDDGPGAESRCGAAYTAYRRPNIDNASPAQHTVSPPSCADALSGFEGPNVSIINTQPARNPPFAHALETTACDAPANAPNNVSDWNLLAKMANETRAPFVDNFSRGFRSVLPGITTQPTETTCLHSPNLRATQTTAQTGNLGHCVPFKIVHNNPLSFQSREDTPTPFRDPTFKSTSLGDHVGTSSGIEDQPCFPINPMTTDDANGSCSCATTLDGGKRDGRLQSDSSTPTHDPTHPARLRSASAQASCLTQRRVLECKDMVKPYPGEHPSNHITVCANSTEGRLGIDIYDDPAPFGQFLQSQQFGVSVAGLASAITANFNESMALDESTCIIPAFPAETLTTKSSTHKCLVETPEKHSARTNSQVPNSDWRRGTCNLKTCMTSPLRTAPSPQQRPRLQALLRRGGKICKELK